MKKSSFKKVYFFLLKIMLLVNKSNTNVCDENFQKLEEILSKCEVQVCKCFCEKIKKHSFAPVLISFFTSTITIE